MLNAGSLRRVPGSSVVVILIGALLASIGAGCQRPSLRPLTEPISSRGEQLFMEGEEAANPPKGPAQPEAPTARVSASIGPVATPLLDAALARARELEASAIPREPSPVPHDRDLAVEVPEMSELTEERNEPGSDPQPPAAEPLPTDLPKRDNAILPAGLPVPAVEVPESLERAADPIDPKVLVKPPADAWKEHLQRLQSLAEQATTETGPSPELWQARATLLSWLATDPPGDLSANSSTIREAVAALEASTPLEIVDLRLCRRVFGFGHYEGIEPTGLRPGQAVIVYCEMSGLRHEPANPGFRSRLETRVKLQSSQDGRVVWSQDLGTAEDSCVHRRRDYYVNYRVNLPDTLSPGDYELVLQQTDLLADHDVTRALGLTIPPSDTGSEGKSRAGTP